MQNIFTNLFLLIPFTIIIGIFIFRLVKAKNCKSTSQLKKLIMPTSLLFLVVFTLAFKTIVDIDTISLSSKNEVAKQMDEKWLLIEGYFLDALEENKEISTRMSENIIEKVTDNYSPEEIDNYLALIGTTRYNPIQKIVGEELQGVYFRGIESDANDPFAMIIGKGEEDSFIFADFSENCSIEKMYRNLQTEYSMHANKLLAIDAFTKMLNLKNVTVKEESIFFQFEENDFIELEVASFSLLKESFYENKGDIEKTFKSLEFLSPTYIYRNKSLGGTDRIINRIKTDAKILNIVSVFSLYEVITHDEAFYERLKSKDENIKNIEKDKTQIERFLLLTSIFATIITLILFLFLWHYVHNCSSKQ